MVFPLRFFLVQCLTYCILVDISHGSALIGTKVRDAKPHELPSVVSIGKKQFYSSAIEKLQYCTGTLVSERHVLTAAHCLFGLEFDETVVLAGDANLDNCEHYDIESWITYDAWKFGDEAMLVEMPYSDLAIITLDDPVTIVVPAKILKFVPQDLYNSVLRIAGWGTSEDGTMPKVLKTAKVHALQNEDCDRLIMLATNRPSQLTADYLCSRSKPYVLSSCGDSGAPLFNKLGQLVAINIGACPPEKQLCHYPKEMVCQTQVNLHLHMHNYRHFIFCLTLNDREECKLARRIKSGKF